MAAKKTKTFAAVSKDDVLAWLKSQGKRSVVEGMARYAISAPRAFGVSVGAMRAYAKRVGKSHELAAALWDSDWYEARMIAVFVEDAAQVTPAQMNAWAASFDNWAICDTACFHLFAKTPHAWKKVHSWATSKHEFVKRASFALLASLVAHDKQADDGAFIEGLALIEAAADDPRNFVKKAVNWALRSVGKRNPTLHAAALETAQRLAERTDASSRWVGKDAIRDLNKPTTRGRFAKKRATREARRTRR